LHRLRLLYLALEFEKGPIHPPLLVHRSLHRHRAAFIAGSRRPVAPSELPGGWPWQVHVVIRAAARSPCPSATSARGMSGLPPAAAKFPRFQSRPRNTDRTAPGTLGRTVNEKPSTPDRQTEHRPPLAAVAASAAEPAEVGGWRSNHG